MTHRPHATHQQRAFFHSALGFLHRHQPQLAKKFLTDLADAARDGQVEQSGSHVRLFVQRLEWDSRFFICPVYRLEFSDWEEDVPNPANVLAMTLKELKQALSARHAQYYLFAEVPSEDIVMLQALGLAGLRLIETRLTYFRDDLGQFSCPERFKVRLATAADIPNLRQVAMEARNHYDRYHADPFFQTALADEYLATFIENSVKGFADVVLVPDDDALKPGAFFTADLLPAKTSLPEINIGRIVLVAVGTERRGWHLRLMSEMSYWFQEQRVQLAYMTTQSTNRAVIRNCEKLGYRYGRSTHIFATHG